ncbi:MAG: cyclohexadieny/prephenate dehydrogenase [Hyphomicrobiaceae bacterium]|jgi:cyclohexadieny/prephenate dehydrogenase
MSDGHFKKIALIGVGLIGSSISHAARRGGLVDSITGHARTAETRDTAVRLGLIDTAHATAAEAVQDADLIILCVPVGACAKVAEEIAPYLKQGSIVTDVGSVKESVVNDVAPHIPSGVHFIPGHPIAGTENSGPEAGFAELFDNRWCILTPLDNGDAAATAKLKAFWQALGSDVDVMTPQHHDMVLATVSHLPHLIAFNIVNSARHLEQVTDREVIKYSAGGFRDFTRIAASDPVMWRDVFLNNKEAVLEMLGRFTEDLTDLQRAIRFGDGDKLERLFTEARGVRQGIVESGQDTAAPDFGRHAGANEPASE